MVSLQPRPSISLKVPELPTFGSRDAEIGRNIGVGEISAAVIRSIAAFGTDRCIAGYGARSHVDLNAGSGRIIAVIGPVEPALSVNEIIAGPSGKFFRRIGRII